MDKLTLRDVSVAGKRVLVRVDFNVPLDDSGKITDDTRIRASMPTIYYLLENGAAVILMSHLGRPKGKPNPKYSLAPVAAHLQELLGAATPVKFAPDCVGPEVREMAHNLQTGEVLLLENLRFHPEEEANDSDFARQLADLADLYVDDAFGSSHRAHASTEGVAHYLPAVAGMLMERELAILGAALDNPERPFVAILGGAKVSDKIGVISNLLNKVDTLIIGGGMANTFLAARGVNVGKSLCEHDLTGEANAIFDRADEAGCTIHLPYDVVVAKEFAANPPSIRTCNVHEVAADEMILDVGPAVVEALADVLKTCRTLVWNGPLGAFETPPFDTATVQLARTAAALTKEGGLISVAGGGDTVAALNHAGVAQDFSFVSTAGGAFLEWMEGRTLPGVAALQQQGDR